jgi:DNA-binding NarL/FixJ family response regulator
VLSDLQEYTQDEVKMTRILIADPDSNTRKALTLLLTHKMGIKAICEAEQADTLDQLVYDFQPDILLLSDSFRGFNPMAACLQLRKKLPTLTIVLLSVNETASETARACGVEFIHKGASLEQTLQRLTMIIGRSL